MHSSMRNQKRKPIPRQLRKLRCPRCHRWLASIYLEGAGVIEMPCRRCKALVQANGSGAIFADQNLTACKH